MKNEDTRINLRYKKRMNERYKDKMSDTRKEWMKDTRIKCKIQEKNTRKEEWRMKIQG